MYGQTGTTNNTSRDHQWSMDHLLKTPGLYYRLCVYASVQACMCAFF